MERGCKVPAFALSSASLLLPITYMPLFPWLSLGQRQLVKGGQHRARGKRKEVVHTWVWGPVGW